MTFEDTIPIREYARLCGCDDKIIRRAIQQGLIPADALVNNEKNGRPMIIPSKADAAWGNDYRAKKDVKKPDPVTVRKTKSRPVVAVQTAEPKPEEAPKSEDAGSDLPSDPDGLPIVTPHMPLKDAVRANEILEANERKIKIRKMRGELVEKDAVYKALFVFGQEIRAELQNIPERIIDDLLASTSRNKGYLLLSGAIEKALEKLSQYPKI